MAASHSGPCSVFSLHLIRHDEQQAVQREVNAGCVLPDDVKQGWPADASAAGSYAVNPVNQEPVPVWVADYVLGSYGSGAIMAVPGHDTRDYEFAQQFHLPILQVVQSSAETQDQQLPFTGQSQALHHQLQHGTVRLLLFQAALLSQPFSSTTSGLQVKQRTSC